MSKIAQTTPLSTQEVKDPAPGTGPGTILRSEREKKGLTLDQVASITKLRVKVVEALENERWGDLPPPVFVRGFIRSYASVVGLDGKELLRLYEQVAAPLQAATGKPEGVQQRSQKGFWLLAVLLALTLGLIAYVLGERSSPSKEQLVQKKQAVFESGREKRDVGVGEKKEPPPAQSTAALTAEAPPDEAERPQAIAEPAEGLAKLPASVSETQVQAVSPDTYDLKGVVLEETWVRIQIDNGGSKEYIFQPGARPQWKAKEGFHLTVGNAAGIELELNGTKLKSLGKPGKVVKLNLPASFKPTRIED